MGEARRARITAGVAKAIASARQRAGMTQAQVAEAVGIGPEAVSRIERGLIEPTVTRVIELAEALGCSVGDLLVPPSDLEIDQARMMARVIAGLSVPDREHVVSLATMAAEYLRANERAHGAKRGSTVADRT